MNKDRFLRFLGIKQKEARKEEIIEEFCKPREIKGLAMSKEIPEIIAIILTSFIPQIIRVRPTFEGRIYWKGRKWRVNYKELVQLPIKYSSWRGTKYFPTGVFLVGSENQISIEQARELLNAKRSGDKERFEELKSKIPQAELKEFGKSEVDEALAIEEREDWRRRELAGEKKPIMDWVKAFTLILVFLLLLGFVIKSETDKKVVEELKQTLKKEEITPKATPSTCGSLITNLIISPLKLCATTLSACSPT